MEKRKGPRGKSRARLAALMLAGLVVLGAGHGRAAPTIPGFYGNIPNLPPPAANALPRLRGIVRGVEEVVEQAAEKKLEVRQNADKAILEWDSFDIGEQAWTHFDQQGNTDWTALNRIYDENPSRIFGRLSADGKVFLINRNGMLFGPQSQVNVHSLVASSLDLDEADFLAGTRRFKAEGYTAGGVVNQGRIETGDLGSVFLLAPYVENAGTINTPSGQIGLAAGQEIEVSTANTVTVKEPGDQGWAVNTADGRMTADTGLAGMYGREVYQEGLIRSVTAIKKGGKIELRGVDKVYTGENSLTTSAISDSTETAHTSFPFEGGQITIGGLASGSPVAVIEHRGEIIAPAGTVNLSAQDRVFLGSGSLIDVGGSWVDLPAEAVTTTLQLNTNELRDAYAQKGGLLQGEEITVNELTGSTIGDISGLLDSEEVAALERSTYGGRVTIKASGDIIIKEGARIAFSGGGVRYGEGHVETTKLLAGREIYDISEAPANASFDKIMGLHETYHERFGVAESFEGLFMGGAAPVKDYWSGHAEARDAGTLTLIAGRIVLEGEIRGTVDRGLYQTEASEPEDENENRAATGLLEPAGGTLIIGDPLDDDAAPADGVHDFALDAVLIQADTTPLGADFGADPAAFPFPEEREGKTLLSAEILNAAGLSNLQIYTNGLFETEADARISLRPGNWQGAWVDGDDKPIGRFYAVAGSILHQGEINVPAGTIRMVARDTVTDFAAGAKKVVLADGSRLLVSGERIDNRPAGKEGVTAALQSGHIHGGQVTVADGTAAQGQGVFLLSGALIDVSGGHLIDEQGGVQAGDAGALSLAGPTLLLEGEIRGHSIPGGDGGSISLHANEVSVVRSSNAPELPTGLAPIPEDLPGLVEEMDLAGKLVLAEDRLAGTGFAHIELKSLSDLTLDAGVVLRPSYAKLPLPTPEQEIDTGLLNNVDALASASGSASGSNAYVQVEPEYAGGTSVTLEAGQLRPFMDLDEDVLNQARIILNAGSKVEVAPGGAIEIRAPGVDVNGELTALSGTVSVTASFADLRMGAPARIIATGYNRPETSPVLEGLPTGYDPQPGGTVLLTAGSDDDSISGNLILEAGSLIDVSGSEPVETYLRKPEGGYAALRVAGVPGSVELAYRGTLTLDAELMGQAKMEALPGGALTLSHLNTQDKNSLLRVTADRFEDFAADGFDDLTFRSVQRIALDAPLSVDVGRRLTLDAPHIEGLGEGLIQLQAPWIRVANTRGQYLSAQEYDDILKRADGTKETALELSTRWLDLEGSVLLTGFESVRLEAEEDIRLTERYYKLGIESAVNKWAGLLKTSADLTLKAARIYPATLSDFTIQGGNRVTILPGDQPAQGPMLSAGGSLSIEADHILHGGFLAAPYGGIALHGNEETGEVVLQAGSRILTTGETPVLYGTLEDLVWRIQDKTAAPSALGLEVADLPEKSVEVTGHSVLLQKGSEVDVSGGGLLFTYLFQPGLEGTTDPLTRAGRYVILPDSSIPLPGDALHLEGGGGIAEGVYSLLPEWCAFLPGAMVITDLSEAGSGYAAGQLFSPEGYPVIQGHATEAGADIRALQPNGYSIRPASDVLAEGYFTVAAGETGAAGTLSLHGATTLLDGVVGMEALPYYRGGIIEVSSRYIAIGRPTDGFAPDMVLEPHFFASMDLEEIRIGDEDLAAAIRTQEIRMYAGALQAPTVILSAAGDVTLMPGSEIHALDESQRLDHLIYRYEYEPGMDLGIVRVKGMRSGSESGLWQAEVDLLAPGKVETLDLVGDDLSILEVLYEDSPDIPAAIDLPTFGAAGAAGGLGTAGLVSGSGTIQLKSGALVHASHEVGLDGRIDIEDGATLTSDHSALRLSGSKITFVPAGYSDGGEGLYLTQSMWNHLSSFDDITLQSRSDLIFLGDYTLAAPGRLTIDAARIAGSDRDETVAISAPRLSLLNTSATSPAGGLLKDDAGALSLSGGLLEIGVWFQEGSAERKITLDGFQAILLASGQDLVFKGQGTLETGWNASTAGADLTLSAARVTTTLYERTLEGGDADYLATDIRLDAGQRTVAIEGNAAAPGGAAEAGGRLDLSAGQIRVGRAGESNSALIEMPSGTLKLNAADSLYLGEGSRIALRGTDRAPGGLLAMRADQGALTVAQGARIDVSAGAQGDAGEVDLYAPVGGVALDGDLLGRSGGGSGGSFNLDTLAIEDLNAMSALLGAGGFTERIALRSRTGDLELGSALAGATELTLAARDLTLTADGGDVLIYANAVLDASDELEGGRIAIYVRDALTVRGNILAAATGEDGQGGEVILSAAHREATGQILLDGALIDVSGPAGGGTVHFRVDCGGQTEPGDLQGTIEGASRISAETVSYYEKSGNIGGVFSFPAPGPFAHGLKDADGHDVAVETKTGIEIWSREGVDLTLNQTWNLSGSNPGGRPGILTLRSGGNLTVAADLQDSRTTRYGLFTNVTGPETWGLRLIAGADLESADPEAIRVGVGDLTLADQKVVYTEHADIYFAAGRDAILLHGKQSGLMINSTMTYNLGTYRGDIRGVVGRDLKIGNTSSSGLLSDRSGGIQTALGDIDLAVGRNLRLNYTAYSKSVGIRTTGGAPRLIWQPEWRDHPELWPGEYSDIIAVVPRFPPNWEQKYLDNNMHSYYHHYAGGGDLDLRVGGALLALGSEAFSSQAWDYAYQGGEWAPSYEHRTSGVWLSAPLGGLATMAGGDLTVRTGGNFESKAGTFGRGDLSIFAGGDLDGKFLVKEGLGVLNSRGNFGLDHSSSRTIEVFDAQIAVFAQGNAVIGEALNPTAREGSQFDRRDAFDNQLIELRYAQDASLAVKTLIGDVTLAEGGIFPPVLDIEAGDDIRVEDRLVLAPSRSSGLRLVAGGDITGAYGDGSLHAEILLSDVAPEAAYAYYPTPTFEYIYPEGHAKAGQTEIITYQPTRALIENRYSHGFPSARPQEKPGNQDYFAIYTGMLEENMAQVEGEEDRAFFQGISSLLSVPVHFGDTAPIEIEAGGDLRDIAFSLPQQARIRAAGNIRDIYYLGQNNNLADLSVIQAGGNIVFQEEPVAATYQVGIEQAGPGFLIVQAGKSLDLGETRGIKAIGDVFNGYLGSRGSDLIVMAGLRGGIEASVAGDVDGLFEGLRTAGMEFSTLMAAGKTDEARACVDMAREEVIYPFIDGYSPGKGDINMITSQIGSDAQDSDVFILARGEINVGKSTFFADEADRKTTGIYTALGGGINIFSRSDVNVNESRIMTYMGGDITIWSDEGNINAGKGSKASINVEPPKLTWVGGVPVIKFTPPAVGSGIRCLTYDPDGYEGPQTPPPPGDIYLTAPEGVIDAGEAGISGGNLFLGATEVLNAQNIEAVGVSVGVPAAAGGANLGSLSGTGSVAKEASKLAENTGGLASERTGAAQQAAQMAAAFAARWLDVKVIGFDEEYQE